MSLWNTVCSVHLCYSVRKSTQPRYEITHKQITVKVFLSQSTQSSRSFLAHISSPQNASGIQRTQSVSAIVDTDKVQHEAYILLIGVSRWSLPFPSGEGKGEGPLVSVIPFEYRKCKAISQSYPPLLSKRGSSTLKNAPFLKREHALLEARRRPSWGKKGMFSNAIRNPLISCRLQAWHKEIWPSYSENDELDAM